jgi:hypothetical protein
MCERNDELREIADLIVDCGSVENAARRMGITMKSMRRYLKDLGWTIPSRSVYSVICPLSVKSLDGITGGNAKEG